MAKHPPQLPVHQEFPVPDGTMCLSSAILIQPDKISVLDWYPAYEDNILWPHLPLLYVLGLRFHLHVAAPVPNKDVYIFAPVAMTTLVHLGVHRREWGVRS